jgi:hypothetical protein
MLGIQSHVIAQTCFENDYPAAIRRKAYQLMIDNQQPIRQYNSIHPTSTSHVHDLFGGGIWCPTGRRESIFITEANVEDD